MWCAVACAWIGGDSVIGSQTFPVYGSEIGTGFCYSTSLLLEVERVIYYGMYGDHQNREVRVNTFVHSRSFMIICEPLVIEVLDYLQFSSDNHFLNLELGFIQLCVGLPVSSHRILRFPSKRISLDSPMLIAVPKSIHADHIQFNSYPLFDKLMLWSFLAS